MPKNTSCSFFFNVKVCKKILWGIHYPDLMRYYTAKTTYMACMCGLDCLKNTLTKKRMIANLPIINLGLFFWNK